MPGTPHDPFAVRLRELLNERGTSYRALAARTFYSKSYLHDLATGRKPPAPDVAARLDEALGAGGQLAALAAGGTPVPVGNGWGRRDSEDLAHALTTTTPTAENAVALAHQWLITEPPQVYEMRSGRRVGAATIDRIVKRTQQLRLVDDHVGGRDTHAVVRAELVATAGLLRDGAYTEANGRRLLACVADLCQLAGWVLADAGHSAQARRVYLAGVRAGHAAGNACAAANNLSSLAYNVANTGDRAEAVTLARSAALGVRHSSTATAVALVLERLAWALARSDDGPAAERVLGQVEDVHGRRRPNEGPQWAYWLTLEEIEVMAGRVWTQLRRPLRAVPILERATAGYGDEVPRETALYATWLAEALLQAREVERAAAVAGRALRLAHRAGSARAFDRVDVLRAQLVAAGGAAVAEFDDEYQTLTATARSGGQ